MMDPIWKILLYILFNQFFYNNFLYEKPNQMEMDVKPLEISGNVNTFSGTGGITWMCPQNFPGASLPFGMVRLSPETISSYFNLRSVNTSGYYYYDNRIMGFSHTRLAGTGATDGGQFLVIPTIEPFSKKIYSEGQNAYYTHKKEAAYPGYYAVRFPKLHILTELTATNRVGVHRYTFSHHTIPHIFINVSNALGDGRSENGEIYINPETKEISGSIRTYGTFSKRYNGINVYFAARFNQEFTNSTLWKNGILYPDSLNIHGDKVGIDLVFAMGNPEQIIELRLAVSYVSIKNARENLMVETSGKTFDDILALAGKKWEEKLSLIKIEGGSEEQIKLFYTALYRSLQMPTIFNDINGDYIGFDNKIHKASGFTYYTDLSLWDTFRTLHPLFNIILQEEQRDMIVSLIQMSKEGGWLPRWPSGNGYTGSMLGSPADMVIAESYLKGIRGFDVESAYQAMKKVALGPTPKGSAYSGRRGIQHYLKYHYIPTDKTKKAVSRTLEYAYADYSIYLLAKALDYEKEAELFYNHSQYYRNLWNPKTQYFQPRYSDGKFFEDFDPLKITYFDFSGKYTKDYVEGSPLQWRWAVPFDIEGFVSLFKNKDYLVEELDHFFSKSFHKIGWWNPGAYYWHGNEPDLYTAYLFNDAGRPDLTQKWVRWILETKYADNEVGLDGNDDSGTLSAWYVFSALGFYPIAGTDIYQIGSPLFKKSVVQMGDKTLTIIADNYSPDNIYVNTVWLNGEKLQNFHFKHAEISNGGTLRFEMNKFPTNLVKGHKNEN